MFSLAEAGRDPIDPARQFDLTLKTAIAPLSICTIEALYPTIGHLSFMALGLSSVLLTGGEGGFLIVNGRINHNCPVLGQSCIFCK